MSSSPAVARARVLTDLLPGERVRDVVLTLGFTAALAIGAQLKFVLPGNPVPISAQTFVALAGGIALGARRSAIGGMLFLGIGVAGVPWFAASNGATLGYIVGFTLAAALLGATAERGWLRTVPQVTGAMVVGSLITYVCGVLWIAAAFRIEPTFLQAFGFDGAPSMGTMLSTFVAPFLIGDAIKVAAAVVTVPLVWRLVGHDR